MVLCSVIGLGILIFCLILIAQQAAIEIWAISCSLMVLLAFTFGVGSTSVQIFLGLGLALLIGCSIKHLRKNFLSRFLFTQISKAMPAMSSTEREALEAGTVSWEGEIFSGSPDFTVLQAASCTSLTVEEQAFIDGPVAELCRMIDDWEITHVRTDLPPEMWQFIKEKGFLGMIIPKNYGGLAFSATAQVNVLTRLYGRSITVGSTVAVPNSLGPAELLLKYGTQAQKDFYLPRLADGREIPCFALTGPNAGSDAASLPDSGKVCRQIVNGEEQTGILLNWDKRYITLCPVATVIGLAFRLFDPENLLKQGQDLGICCALIPADTPGVKTGRRHFPLNTAFLNGPTQGKNVFIPLDYLIGGVAMAGKGWRMLMECLSVGRAISLPSSAAGGVQVCALASGAYARVRKQFNRSIADFEGIEEPLARIAGNSYLIDAGLSMAAAAIDAGAQPSVAGAILKYHTTERARQVIIDAMDIHGGKGICLGPNNYLGRGYQNSPISITVEGANILTRSLIIFGQGAIRCHPYIFQELEAVRENNLKAFDKAFWSHFSFILANGLKSIIFNFSDAYFTPAPQSTLKRYYQLINRYSANLAFLADFAMIILGGALKRKEKLSARLGDILSNLYLASAVLKRFYEDGEPLEDKPLAEWSCQQLLHETEIALQAFIANFPGRSAQFFLKLIVHPFGMQRQKPSDRLGKKLADILTRPNASRTRLTRFVFKEANKNCPLGRLEEAFLKIIVVEELEKKIKKEAKEGVFTSLTLLEQIEEAIISGFLNPNDALLLKEAELARQEIIAVDDFADEELRREPKENFFLKEAKIVKSLRAEEKQSA